MGVPLPLPSKYDIEPPAPPVFSVQRQELAVIRLNRPVVGPHTNVGNDLFVQGYMAEITVVLRWKRLRKWQDVHKVKKDNLGSGICMITGYHPVFGNNSLLYVGDSDGVMLGPGIVGMRAGENNAVPNGARAYLSQVESINDDPDYSNEIWESIKKKVGALLAFYHIPPFNHKWTLNVINFSRLVCNSSKSFFFFSSYVGIFDRV